MEYIKEFLDAFKTNEIKLSIYSAVIQIGSWCINLIDKTFTKNQIRNIREYFGWEIKNLCE